MTKTKVARKKDEKHGYAPKEGVRPEYKSWSHMKYRCLNKGSRSYADYGGRGITVYEPWIKSFKAFLDYIGPRPEPKHDYSLDRIDTYGNYEPGNVRWATKQQQRDNSRPRTNIKAYGKGICIICGKDFVKNLKSKHIYCGSKCRDVPRTNRRTESHALKLIKECGYCGKFFKGRFINKGMACSKQCYYKMYRSRKKANGTQRTLRPPARPIQGQLCL